ncbi:C-type lectin [Holothuria leucospilota]|uniref:C-type lectin n=1 Tax=Holothuria leucospilota TaxID=206669 RepID=A0A9Q1HCF1_HOLLE|nr:C-type lectin [Holothuria leucospilota]
MFFRITLLLIGCWSSLGAIVIEPCPPGWTEYKGYCYRYFSHIKSWTEAQDFCRNVGANGYSTGSKYQTSDLTSIHSAAENDFLYHYWLSCRDSNTADVTNLYIGLNDPGRDRVWKWVDGSESDYVNWNTGEPNNYENRGEFYVTMLNNKKWNDEHVSDAKVFTFICKMPRDYDCRIQ